MELYDKLVKNLVSIKYKAATILITINESFSTVMVGEALYNHQCCNKAKLIDLARSIVDQGVGWEY